ncbi:ATPase [Flavobacterium ardleyense]|uniref:ATPase n=1 Tax=Flavobacterium ardleyense TaxID=2038737 RepID=A0ABW5ZC19_9FLAO
MEKHFKNIQDTYVIQNGVKGYNFEYCLNFIEVQGKIKYGRYFKIDTNDYNAILKLVIYAIRDEKAAQDLKIDLNKGILLTGPIGCGKTSIMALIRPFFYAKQDYKIKTCREISFEFAKNGFEALQNYTQKEHQQARLPGYCFDDLGAEQNIKHYGNDLNVMAEIIISRYEDFVQNQSISHITTNLSASEIEALYGNRLRSRMRSMFNLITFSNESRDKR